MIEMRPGKGAYIRRLSLNDVVRMVDGAVKLEYGTALQLHEVRAMIEISAARLAANRRTEQDLVAMRDAILHYRIAAHANNPDEMVEADLSFHGAIVNATHNAVFISLFVSIQGLLREHRRQYVNSTETAAVDLVIGEHDGIYESISVSDHKLAARRMQTHMALIWRQVEATATHEQGSSLDGQGYLPMYDDAGE
jgi:GntR family transcriptional repressor for pyruvate dehydrogenase complex